MKTERAREVRIANDFLSSLFEPKRVMDARRVVYELETLWIHNSQMLFIDSIVKPEMSREWKSER